MRKGVAAMVLGIMLAAGIDAAAQMRPRGEGEQGNEPILFRADEIQTDQELGLIVARGNVEFAQENRRLLADTVTYNQRTDTVTASGTVTLLEATGEILFADFVELTQRMNEGFAKDIRILLTDRSRLAGNTGRRTGGVRTELRRGVYSPCDLCREDPTRAPAWQLRASSIAHDEETHRVEYRDAMLEVAGIPVFYTPYLSHPDPTVKRQSGLLAPSFGAGSSSLGTHIQIPYFWAIDDSSDITFAPIFTFDGGVSQTGQSGGPGVVGAGEYRKRFGAGEISASGSITESDILTSEGKTRPAVRGHLFSEGRWHATDTTRAGYDFRRATDQTYLRSYRFGGTEPYLTTRGFVENFGSRSFAALNTYAFQTLRAGTEDATQPIVLPEMTYSAVSGPDSWGGRWTVGGSLLSLSRDKGTDSYRASTGAEWRAPFAAPLGQVVTLYGAMRGDGYWVGDYVHPGATTERNGPEGRVFPQVAAEWRWPFIRRGEAWHQLVEPITAVVLAPTGLNRARRIPNEDSTSFEFDETDLFVPNRFAGIDRVDVGQRVDYGVRATIYGDSGGSTGVLVGQSYRLQSNNDFPDNSGLQERLSDVVGRIAFTPGGFWDLMYRFRLDKHSLAPQRQEIRFNGGPEQLRLGLSYLDLQPLPEDVIRENRNQISAGISAGLTRYWTLSVYTTRNLSGEETSLYSSAAATYRDECVTFVASINQSGTRDRDLRPGTTVFFSVILKNLGELVTPVFEQAQIQRTTF
jgi:LPS-assembly protein